MNIMTQMKRVLKKTCIYSYIYVPLKELYTKMQIKNNPEAYIKKRYKRVVGRTLDLSNPVTYTEKIQWRKLYDNDPLLTLCADKIEVRNFIQDAQLKYGLDENLVSFPRSYGVFSDPDEIDFQELPNKFVLKSNHASGQVIISTNKDEMNLKKVRKELHKWIKTNFYYVDAEKHYKDIKPKIICEELLENNIIDYRFFCFNGEPYLIKVTQHNNNTVGGYDEATFYSDWSKADIIWNKNYGKLEIEKPENLENMLKVARVLSMDYSFVRVDLYSEGGKVYFSELTFTPNSGLERDMSYEWDRKLGDMFSIS